MYRKPLDIEAWFQRTIGNGLRGESNGHVTGAVMWPWKVKLVTPIGRPIRLYHPWTRNQRCPNSHSSWRQQLLQFRRPKGPIGLSVFYVPANTV